MNVVDKLTEMFKNFPGVGERQARRFAYFLMSKNDNFSNELTTLISKLKDSIARCPTCFRFFLNSTKNKNCEICQNANSSTLLVIEKDSDFESIHKSHVYDGKYFLLGGLVPVVEKKTPKYVRINELKQRLEGDKEIKEVILAFSLNPQGEHTDHYVRGEIQDICGKNKIKISTLGRGLSTGTELEYSDDDTLMNALKNRQ